MAKGPQIESRSYLLSIRASIILALSAIVGATGAGLTVASGGGWAAALLAGGVACGGAIALFNQIIGDDALDR